jgi:hypothetical protein
MLEFACLWMGIDKDIIVNPVSTSTHSSKTFGGIAPNPAYK